MGIVAAACITTAACNEPPPGTRADHEATVVELALRERMKTLGVVSGTKGVVYCVDGAWNLANLQAEGYPVRQFVECASQGVGLATDSLPPAAEPFWRNHPISAPLFVESVSWPQPRRGVVRLLDGGTPKERGITARVVSRYEFVWNPPVWEIANAASESARPDAK